LVVNLSLWFYVDQPAVLANTAIIAVGVQPAMGTARGIQRRRGSISEIEYALVGRRGLV